MADDGRRRRYRAEHSFSARRAGELTIYEGETVVVKPLVSGAWPDDNNWMNGRNEKTGDEGDFPGNYTILVEEFATATVPALPPKPAPRTLPRSRADPVSPPVPGPRPGWQHDLMDIHLARPYLCRHCK